MSKIICDVCGSSYSENETQCPICGTARSDAAKPAAEPIVEEQAPKGGRFTKNNGAKPVPAGRRSANGKDGKDEPSSNLPMIIIVAVLLLAIVIVCVFIFVRALDKPDKPTVPSTSSTAPTAPPTTAKIPCTGIELVDPASQKLTFNAANETAKLNVRALPENTTETITYTFTSSNPAVVLVDQTGLVTPVAKGTATITISYGHPDSTITVDVTVNLPVKLSELKLEHAEATLSPDNGLTLNLYSKAKNGDLEASEITWTSSDEKVATVKDGVVTAVGKGNCTITAKYGELTKTCKIIVSDIKPTTGYTVGTAWLKNDITIEVGASEFVFLENTSTKDKVTGLTWTPSPDFPKCCSFVETSTGIKVTANKVTSSVSGGYVYIKTTYEGVEYKLIIRVKPADNKG